jgi:hyperosmotically inducible protein
MMVSAIVGMLGSMSAYAAEGSLTMVPLVQKYINLDSRIDSTNLHVTNQGSKVVISGTVGSIFEKQLVEETAKSVVGSDYSASGLKVVPPLVSDTDIKRGIEASVPTHCQVKLQNFDVQVKDGNVTLLGQTDSLHHSTMAGYVASNVRGVKSVTNRIVVNDNRASDKLIRENVSAVLDGYLKKNGINWLGVAVKNGMVTLSGDASSYEQERHITDVVQRLPGVVSVQNKIVIRRSDFGPGDGGGRY